MAYGEPTSQSELTEAKAYGRSRIAMKRAETRRAQSPTYAIAHGSAAVHAVRIIAGVAASKKCPKCGNESGDDWRQCRGSCPMPMSPHYLQTAAPQQCAEQAEAMLSEVASLIASWRSGHIKSLSVISRLDGMFPGSPSVTTPHHAVTTTL